MTENVEPELNGGTIAAAKKAVEARDYPDIAERLDEFGLGERRTIHAADLLVAHNSLVLAEMWGAAADVKEEI